MHTIVARKDSKAGLYAIKAVQKCTSSSRLLKHIRSEQACLRMVTEDGDCYFLPKLHKSFQDESRLYMVLVRTRLRVRFVSIISDCLHRIPSLVEVSQHRLGKKVTSAQRKPDSTPWKS